MNQSAQGDINCPHCECSIRIEGTLKKNTIRCSNCKKIIDDVESRLIPLASTIDLLPSKRPDSQNVNIETLIQENTNQAHIPTEEKAQNKVNISMDDDSTLIHKQKKKHSIISESSLRAILWLVEKSIDRWQKKTTMKVKNRKKKM